MPMSTTNRSGHNGAADSGDATRPMDVWSSANPRERIPSSPLLPDSVKWAEDGRVAVVSDTSIFISTFMNRELEMYLQQPPAISKSFIFAPEHIDHERVPIQIPVFDESTDTHLPTGSATSLLMYDTDRHQNNPKELSLSKSEGKSFVSVAWGPRGSGPSSSCAILALTAASRISLHFSSSFHLSWKETAVVSETLYDFLEQRKFNLRGASSSNQGKNTSPTPTSSSKKRKRRESGAKAHEMTDVNSQELITNSCLTSIAEYTRRSALLATLTMAWSSFILVEEQRVMSLIALAGRALCTIWEYPYPKFDATTEQNPVFVSPTPLAWIDTEKYGWVTTSTWQQVPHQPLTLLSQITLALGTTSGNVLLSEVPVAHGDPIVPELTVDRVILAPHSQPVFHICLGCRDTLGHSNTRNDLIVASGSTISVWDSTKERPQKKNSWKAHEGNISAMDVDYFGDTVFSGAVDGTIKVWEKQTGKELLSNVGDSPKSPEINRYPISGLAVSPNSVQVACVYIIPPAARPNRKSQADVSYSRVSSSLEYLPSPYMKNPADLVNRLCRILEQSRSVSALADIVWFCHEDNSALTSLHGSADMTIPNLLNKLKGVSTDANNELARQPLYLNLCDELEKRCYSSQAPKNVPSKSSGSADMTIPVFLQASYLLRTTIRPAENHAAIRDSALTRIRRTLYVYWARRCLNELLASHSEVENFADISTSERISALLMADFLSVQLPLNEESERLVTTVYSRLGSEENVTRWFEFLQEKAKLTTKNYSNGATTAEDEPPVAIAAPVPPPRQTCFICEQPVPFSEFDLCCVSGHAQDRCFLSFQAISSMDTWKCMGCSASASEIDFSSTTSPFYLLDSQAIKSLTPSTAMKIICRLCGNYCSFFKY